MIRINAHDIAEVVNGEWLGGATSPEVAGVGTDTRECLAGRLFVAIPGERHDGHDHLAAAAKAGAVAAMVERIPDDSGGLPLIRVEDVRKALADLAGHHRSRLHQTTVISITGSAGKTTVRRMAEAVLSLQSRGSASPRSFNNDLGVPLTMLAASPEDRWLLVEVGTNAPGEIAALTRLVSPQVAIITGIGRAHLGGFGGEQELASEKASMLDHLQENGHAIVQVDSALIHPELEARAAKPIRFTTYGRSLAADLRLTGRQPLDGSQRIEIDGSLTATLSLPGEHNAVNALGVIALARHLGMSDEDIAAGLGRVEPAPGRMEPVEVAGIHVVHDAYNANPESMVAALVTFAETAAGDRRKVAVLGEMRELGEQSDALHREVGAAAARAELDLLVGVGAGGGLILDGARAAGHAGDAVAVTLEDDVLKIAELCRRGDQVLLKASRGVRLERVLAEWKNSDTGIEGTRPA